MVRQTGIAVYEALLHRIAADIRAAGPCWTALAPHATGTQTPMAMPLLLLAAVHRHVLEGRGAEAARYYPPWAVIRMRKRYGRISSTRFRASPCPPPCRPTK